MTHEMTNKDLHRILDAVDEVIHSLPSLSFISIPITNLNFVTKGYSYINIYLTFRFEPYTDVTVCLFVDEEAREIQFCSEGSLLENGTPFNNSNIFKYIIDALDRCSKDRDVWYEHRKSSLISIQNEFIAVLMKLEG